MIEVRGVIHPRIRGAHVRQQSDYSWSLGRRQRFFETSFALFRALSRGCQRGIPICQRCKAHSGFCIQLRKHELRERSEVLRIGGRRELTTKGGEGFMGRVGTSSRSAWGTDVGRPNAIVVGAEPNDSRVYRQWSDASKVMHGKIAAGFFTSDSTCCVRRLSEPM